MALQYDATVETDGEESPLKGAGEVYLLARAVYGDGQEAVVEQIGQKTLMTSTGLDKWVLWIYPHEFFGIPAGERIESVCFRIVNGDGSVEVRMPDGSEFTFSENDR